MALAVKDYGITFHAIHSYLAFQVMFLQVSLHWVLNLGCLQKIMGQLENVASVKEEIEGDCSGQTKQNEDGNAKVYFEFI